MPHPCDFCNRDQVWREGWCHECQHWSERDHHPLWHIYILVFACMFGIALITGFFLFFRSFQ